MAKLSFKPSENDDQNKIKISFKLTSKQSVKQSNTIDNTQKSKQTEKLNKNLYKFENAEKFLSFVFENLGKEFKYKFKKNLFVFSFDDQQLTEKQKFFSIFKQFFTSEELKKINNFIDEHLQIIKDIEKSIEQKNLQIENLKKQLNTLKNAVNESEEEVFRIKKYYERFIPIDLLLTELKKLDTKPQISKMAEVIAENFESMDRQQSLFCVNFLGFFPSVVRSISFFGENQKNNMEQIYQILKLLLLNIKGLHPPYRRILLDLVAQYVNNYFTEYTFISPEQTLQIDPAIHNAEGVGGNIIVEGLSFVVIRRDTNKTVKFADITTQ